MNHYDLIVLGSGSAARDAAAKAVQQCGASVAVVESTRWGGSCPNVACKPTKAYLVVAELFHDVNRLAGKLGIDVGPARLDLGARQGAEGHAEEGRREVDGGAPGSRIRHVRRRGRAPRSWVGRDRRPGAARRPDPDRDRLADGRAADRGHRRDRLDRPRLGTRADRASGVAARRRGRSGRARVRSDLRALRLPGDDRPGRGSHLAAFRRGSLHGAARGARGGRRSRDRALFDRRRASGPKATGSWPPSARGRSVSRSSCSPRAARRTSRRCTSTSSESSTTVRASSSTS